VVWESDSNRHSVPSRRVRHLEPSSACSVWFWALIFFHHWLVHLLETSPRRVSRTAKTWCQSSAHHIAGWISFGVSVLCPDAAPLYLRLYRLFVGDLPKPSQTNCEPAMMGAKASSLRIDTPTASFISLAYVSSNFEPAKRRVVLRSTAGGSLNLSFGSAKACGGPNITPW